MSSDRKRTEGNDMKEKLSKLRAMLGNEISTARLTQILEASDGSLEHAIEIHFSQMQQQSRHTKTDPKEDRPRVITSVKHGSSESISDRKRRSSNKSRVFGYHSQSNSEDSNVAIINRKRGQSNLSINNNREKEAKTKQARLETFFRVNHSNNGTSTPSSIQMKEGPKGQLDKGKKETNNVATKVSTSNCVPDFSPKKARLSKTISKPICVDTEFKESGLKNINHTNAESTSSFPFQRLCETLQEMTDTTKRLVKLNALETLIREIIDSRSIIDVTSAPTEKKNVSTRACILSAALELVLGGITSKPLNVSGSAVSKALQTCLGITRNQMSKAYRKYGDTGDSAASFFQKKSHFLIVPNRSQLSILQVAEALRKISELDGRDTKQHVLLTLLRRCESKTECRFLVRLLLRNMRIGANIKTVLAALAMAIVPKSSDNKNSKGSLEMKNGNENVERNLSSIRINTKDVVALVQKTYDVCPSILKIVSALLEGGLQQMKIDCAIQIMTPIAPMLAHPIHSLDEIKEKMGNHSDEAIMEWKYDGMRCQAHYDGSKVQLFSRHMLDMTDQFQDVIIFLKEALRNKTLSDSTSFIIDAEIVGVEGQGNDSRLLPFQDLSTRRKKVDDGKGIKVKVFAFDIMFFNGDSLVNEELFSRKSILHELFVETNNFSFVSSQKLVSYNERKIKSFLLQAINNGAEGLMIKLLGKTSMPDANQKNVMNEKPPEGTHSFYEAGTRSHSWLKVKRDYVAGFSDTIDVVPIGAWWGTGRKAQKSFLSPILLAVYDDEEDVYRSICRCMTFTDAMYESIRKFYFNGSDYPSCVDSEDPQEIRGNDQLKRAPAEHFSVDDDSSCEDYKDKSQNDEENNFHLEVEETHGCVNNDRVNCFPSRPSSAFVVTNESPPIWFKPMEVFEVAFADLSLSRQHTAAAGLVDEEGRGVALRFPRFKRRRPDKKPEQATTSIQAAQLFAKQSKIKKGTRAS